MKLNKIILVSIFLLAIMTLTPLCASDNVAVDDSSIQNDGPAILGDPDDDEWENEGGDDEFEEGDPDDDEWGDEGGDDEFEEGDDEIYEGDGEGDNNEDDYIDYDFDGKSELEPEVICPENMLEGADEFFIIEMPENATGSLLVNIDDKEYPVPIKDGKATVSLKNLKAGDIWIDFSYEGNEYYEEYYSDCYIINIFKVSHPAQVYQNSIAKITLSGPLDYYGRFYVTVDKTTKSSIYEDEECTVSIQPTTLGTKTVTFVLKNDEGEIDLTGTFTMNVIKKPIIKANHLTMFSTQSKYYTIRLLDGNGKALSGKTVTFYLDGIKLKSVPTDSNGYAKVKIAKQSAYTYKIKTVYNGISVTKTLKIKPVLGSFIATSAKNAKAATIQIKTNKVDGKFLKGKTVTFKFNGVKYKAAINSKGIAKVSIPKNAFAKCKTGKSYFIDAIFGYDSNSAIIQFSKVKPKLTYKLITRIPGAGGC